MKILHTSDWHLGHLLCGQKRTAEFTAFLNWLTEVIARERIEVLVVAGDLFDTTTPSHQVQSLYYAFLGQAMRAGCRHVVIVAGNHDSPSLVDAPRALLDQLDIHVVGAVPRRAPKTRAESDVTATEVGSESAIAFEDEVLVLDGARGRPQLIVCAVPYLKERDVRTALSGEGEIERTQQVLDGIRTHYARVCEIAEARRQALSADIPILATGHLFTSGGVADNGERDLLVGSLLQVDAEATFPASIDYLALGHLHAPQLVGGRQAWRYSGSPLPMGFADAQQHKSVCIVEFAGRVPNIQKLKVPFFQELRRISGRWEEIAETLARLGNQGSSAWLEIVHQGEAPLADLSERVDKILDGMPMIALLCREAGQAAVGSALGARHASERLQDLDEGEVFERLLDQRCPDWTAEELEEVRATFREALQGLRERDRGAH